jgi:hypothetical protein
MIEDKKGEPQGIKRKERRIGFLGTYIRRVRQHLGGEQRQERKKQRRRKQC